MNRRILHFLRLPGFLLAFCIFFAGCGKGDFSDYEGIWLAGAQYDYDYIEIDADGNWEIYRGGEVAVSGHLRYVEDWECIYAYDDADGSGCPFVLEGDELYIAAYGYFSRGEGMENVSYEDGDSGDDDLDYEDDDWDDDLNYEDDDWDDDLNYEDDDWGDDFSDNDYNYVNPDLQQIDISEFAGVWYYDGDLAASTFIVIDSDGNWSYYERADGDGEAAEMDYGSITPSEDEVSTYYANSSVYAGLTYRMFEFDTGIIIWDDDAAYERME